MTDSIPSDRAGDPSPTRTGGMALQYWFVIALALGSIAIFLGERRASGSAWITIGVPIAVMGAYLVIGRSYLAHGISRTQYADSIYYLGFLFTLVSIVAAIRDFGPDADVSKIVNRFGAKLITTLIGLGSRVYLVNFRPSTEDLAENVEEALAQAARRLHDRLDAITLDLNSLSSALVLTLTGATERVSTELSQTITQANSSFQDALSEIRGALSISLSDLSDTARRSGAGVAESVTGTATELDRLRDRLVGAEAEIATHAEVLGARLRAAELPADVFVAQLLPSIQHLADSLREPTKQIAEAGSALANATVGMSHAVGKASDLAQSVTLVEGEMTQLAGSLTSLESSLGAVAARSAEAARFSELEVAQLRARGARLDADHELVLQLMKELHEVLESAKHRRHQNVLSRMLSRSKG